MAKKSGMSSSEAVQLNKGVKGTSIGNGAFKIGTLNKHKRRNFKAYRGQGK